MVRSLGFYDPSNVASQFDASSNASLTLIHESCPAGFKISAGLIQGHFVCRCSKTDLNIQSCNETTADVLLKVRESEVKLCA